MNVRTLFLAGATGAVGRRLIPLLVADGWKVVGLTRDPGKGDDLRRLGAVPAFADAFDAAALRQAVEVAAPDVVVHQLTDLPPGLDPALMAEATARNARIREEGTRNLVAAALAAGARRIVAQSVAFAYAEGPKPYREADALAVRAEGRAGVSARGAASLESQIEKAAMASVVLRYGRLYGPGTGFAGPAGPAPCHVDAAACAAALAVERGGGIYNVAEDDGVVSSEKVKRELGWSAAFRCPA